MREERIIALPILLREYPRELLHKRLVRHVEPQWRHRNAVFGHGRHMGTALPRLTPDNTKFGRRSLRRCFAPMITQSVGVPLTAKRCSPTERKRSGSLRESECDTPD